MLSNNLDTLSWFWRVEAYELISQAIVKRTLARPFDLLKSKTARRSLEENGMKRREMMKTQKYCCWCGDKLNKKNVSIEHIMPLALGGSTKHKNVILACRRCNEMRGAILGNAISLAHKHQREFIGKFNTETQSLLAFKGSWRT